MLKLTIESLVDVNLSPLAKKPRKENHLRCVFCEKDEKVDNVSEKDCMTSISRCSFPGGLPAMFCTPACVVSGKLLETLMAEMNVLFTQPGIDG